MLNAKYLKLNEEKKKYKNKINQINDKFKCFFKKYYKYTYVSLCIGYICLL